MAFDQLQPTDGKHAVNSSLHTENAISQAQWQPADAKYPVNPSEHNVNAMVQSSDDRYPVNRMERNGNAFADSSNTAWDPYEYLAKQGKTGGQVMTDYSVDGGSQSIKEMAKLGFPTPDLSGFDQEAPNKDGGFWHGLKHLFVRDETNGEKVRDSVLKDMSQNPKEQKQYDQEEKDLKDYHSKMLRWETQANMNPGNPPSPPDCPMHEEVERRVQMAEKQIAAQVEASMSPEDRDRLHKQMDEYSKACGDRYKDENPMGTGGGMGPMPEPGNAIKDYYDRIGEATERYVSGSQKSVD